MDRSSISGASHRAVLQGTARQGTATQGTATQGTATQGTATQGTAAQGTAAQGTAAQGTVQPGPWIGRRVLRLRAEVRHAAVLLLGLAALALGGLAACGSEGAEESGTATAPGSDVSTTSASGETDAASDSRGSASGTVSGTSSLPGTVIQLLDDARITSRSGEENFQRVRADLDPPTGPWAAATLVVELDTTCYPFEKWQDDPPPAGQNWPARCDAFDRNFEVLLRDRSREEPAFEVERAITPFGGPMELSIDVADLLNARPGPWELEVYIATWPDGAGQVTGSDGGWNVSARLVLEEGTPPRPVVAAVPLHDGSMRHEEPRAEFAWEAPEGASSARLELRMTGHGGAQAGDSACIGPAEEFCRRRVDLLLNGNLFSSYELWRDDCAEGCSEATRPGGQMYCAENPTGLPASVRAPRANWCPGAVTPPEVFEDARLLGAQNAFEVSVPALAEGGVWRTSALIYFYE